ncbi:hypothetical protein [Lysinibacillus capsici]|uniref:hypothetical protein n=1 Tax=Lysinibacillus capsici TaxID=2115968 RepID=UPI000E1FE144|nr:hypothetical protein [Lysinibacillus capsici]RDV35890.1 hypothetical protein C7B89_00005 [Lysinibacillus capsici]
MLKKKYAIVKRMGEKEEFIGTVEAESFEKAETNANRQYAKEKQAMKTGDAWLVIELAGDIVFDAEGRVVNTSGNLNMFYKF